MSYGSYHPQGEIAQESNSHSYYISSENVQIEIESSVPLSVNNFHEQSSEEPTPYSATTNQPALLQETNPPSASGTTEKARATVKEFGINLDKPKHPQFAVLSVRIKSYENKWPENLRQTPKELSLAGFFYGGVEDTVFCFFCGQGLHSWEDTDDPWEEHAKWSSKCVFLRNVKGPEFIEAVLAKDTNPEKYLAWKKAEEEKERRKKTPKVERDCRPRTQNGVSVEAMNSSAFLSVIEVFGKEVAEEALKIFIKRQGNIQFTTDDLTNIVFDIEDGNICELVDPIDVADGGEKRAKTPVDEELHQLMEENLSLKKQTTCVICHNELVSVVFLPCGHICCCADCSPAMKDCPLCNVFVKGTVRTYLT